MGIKSLVKVVAFGLVVGLLCSGCGSGVTVVSAAISPSISLVSPQVVAAGTPNVTVTVQGTNFQSQSSLMVNGAAVPTTMVNSTTLAAQISGSTLAQPAVAQLQVRNTNGASSNQVPLTVTGATQTSDSLAITTTQLPSAQVGTAYQVTFNASGGTTPYTWALSSGKLPGGLTLSSAGVLSGTPTASGTFTFAIKATDSSSPKQTKTTSFSLVVAKASQTVPATLSISSTTLGSAQVASSYSTTLSATGGTASYTWSISSGSLPAGLSLSSGGVISGTPTSAGTATFTVQVKDSGSPQQTATAQETLSVAPAALAITSTSLAAGKTGSSYSATLSATGGTPSYTWSISSGSLPAGLSLSSAGVISGKPTKSGTATFTVEVKDSGSPQQSASAQESITVSSGTSTLAITTTSLSAGKTGSSYSSTLSATGGTPSYTWSISSGSLPAGLSLSSGGVISGTPTSTGTATFTVAVKDSGSPQQTASSQESITVAVPALSITSTSLAAGKTGSSYSATLSATGGTPSYTWSISSGSLPAGLSLSSAGAISGTPTSTGTATFTVVVKDSGSPQQSASSQESITIAAGTSTLTITSTSLGAATTGSSYSTTLNATGGTPNYTWSVSSGSLPAGLSLSSGGVISGTPTSTGTATFTVTVKDSGSPQQTASVQESIKVAAGTSTLTITTSSLSAGTSGSSYSSTLSATGGTPSYTWSVSSGSLPAGLSLSSGGVISGTPTSTGTATFTVTVKDSGSPQQTASAQESITVAAGSSTLTITTTSLSAGTTGSTYSSTLSATGGTPSYTWTVSSGSLPAGLSLSSAGVISGTPTATGSSSFTVGVSDSSSPAQSATAQESITIAAAAATSAGTTWYVRPDGGTRYSSNATNGQCDGQGDQSYAAAVQANGGTAAPNLHCAFNDVRLLWQDGSYVVDGSSFPAWGWIIQGGDTVIIRGSIGTGATYRIGWPNNSSCIDSTISSDQGQARGICGDPYNSGMPPPPAGTASQHTRILGENYGACTAQSARTQLHGGFGIDTVVQLTGTSDVDVECLDITDFSACTLYGTGTQCNKNIGSLDDFAKNGIRSDNTLTDSTITDVRMHGLASTGQIGATGDGVAMTDVAWIGNGASGWNSDDGSGATGTGNLSVTNFQISWNGCEEEYPLVDALPYSQCYDDNSNGYGDGFGTASVASNPAWNIHFDQGLVTYNTQDGLDSLHLTGSGSQVIVTRTMAYGNMGQQIKIGGASGEMINNVVVGNCNAMRQAIPGTPSGYNAGLSDFCRAADTAIDLHVGKGVTTTVQFNTVYSAQGTTYEIDCDTSNGNCDSTSLIDFRNNIFVGFLNNTANGYSSTSPVSNDYSNPIYMTNNGDPSWPNPFTNPGSYYSNNVTYHPKSNWSCPNTGWGETNAICSDPGLSDETWYPYSYGDMSPSTQGNAVQGMGANLPSVTVDYTGAPRGNPPSIGAYENYVSLP